MSDFVPKVIRQLIAHYGLKTQSELSEVVKIPQSLISRWARGGGITMEKLEKLLSFLPGADLNRALPDYDPTKDVEAKLRKRAKKYNGYEIIGNIENFEAFFFKEEDAKTRINLGDMFSGPKFDFIDGEPKVLTTTFSGHQSKLMTIVAKRKEGSKKETRRSIVKYEERYFVASSVGVYGGEGARYYLVFNENFRKNSPVKNITRDSILSPEETELAYIILCEIDFH